MMRYNDSCVAILHNHAVDPCCIGDVIQTEQTHGGFYIALKSVVYTFRLMADGDGTRSIGAEGGIHTGQIMQFQRIYFFADFADEFSVGKDVEGVSSPIDRPQRIQQKIHNRKYEAHNAKQQHLTRCADPNHN